MRYIFGLAITVSILMTVAETAGRVSSRKLQGPKPALLDEMIDMNLSNATLMEVLDTLAVDHRVPVGLEEAVDSRERINRSIRIQTGTLRTILDSVVAQEPRYQWELRDGVINVTPTIARDAFLQSLLETRIDRFVPPKGGDKFKIRDAIVDLPEVKRLLQESKVEILKRSYPSRRSVYSNDDVDLRISNTDVRGVLNKVARESEHKSWTVERIGERKEWLLVSN